MLWPFRAWEAVVNLLLCLRLRLLQVAWALSVLVDSVVNLEGAERRETSRGWERSTTKRMKFLPQQVQT